MEQIDISQVIRDKNPKLAKRIPAFVINYLRRILHEDQINEILRSYGHLHGIPFIKAALAYMDIKYDAVGIEKVPLGGRYIFASNHPFGGMDGLMLAVLVAGRFGDVRVVVNDLLMNIDPLRELFIPVNKHGRQNQDHAEAFNSAFMSDIPIITFPAGLCSRRIDGKISDLPWKTNFIRKAMQSGRDIVPVFFPGILSNRFYRIANIRKKTGIKANIEMLYLSDEMFKQYGRSFEISFGEPISFEETLKDMPVDKACDYVRQKVYALNTTVIKK